MHESGLFLNDWKEAEIGLLEDQFDLTDAALSDVEILLASYSRDDTKCTAKVTSILNLEECPRAIRDCRWDIFLLGSNKRKNL